MPRRALLVLFVILAVLPVLFVACDDSDSTTTPVVVDPVDVTGANLYCSSLALTRSGIQGDVRIIGADGTALATLPASQLRVWLEPEGSTSRVDGTVASVQSFAQSGRSIATSLVLDCSGSMSGASIDRAKQAASTFVHLFQAGDKAAFFRFNENVTLVNAMTTDTALLVSSINASNPLGATALYDAVNDGALAAAQVDPAQYARASIVLSDGGDNSSLLSLPGLLTNLTQHGVAVFTIGYNVDSTVAHNLLSIANQSGGAFFITPSSTELLGIYTTISTTLRRTLRLNGSWGSSTLPSAGSSATLVIALLNRDGSTVREFRRAVVVP